MRPAKKKWWQKRRRRIRWKRWWPAKKRYNNLASRGVLLSGGLRGVVWYPREGWVGVV